MAFDCTGTPRCIGGMGLLRSADMNHNDLRLRTTVVLDGRVSEGDQFSYRNG